MGFEFATVTTITVICYFLAYTIKTLGKIDKWIPSICGACGSILGVVGMFVIPQFPANDILTALAVGCVSGFAATGINQVYKQMKKGGVKNGD